MGTCQSTASALYAFPRSSTPGKVRSSKRFARTRKSQKLKLEIQKYDTTNPTVFSPSGTRETVPATPSSLFPSPTLYARTASSIESAASCQEKQRQPESKNTMRTSEPTLNSSKVQIGTIIADYETQSTSAVPSGVVEQFQKLKLEAQMADRSKQTRKRKEKIASRKAMDTEYRHLWRNYEQIQDEVSNQNSGECIPKSISFLNDSDAWYIDFHTIHNQQPTMDHGMTTASPTAANLSLLSQSNIEAQKKFFQKKSHERKQRKKRKGQWETNIVKDQSVASTSLGDSSFQERGCGSKREETDGTPRYNSANDYNVLHRIRSSSSTQNTTFYLDQTLSHIAPASEPTLSSSIVLEQNFPRKRNEDISIRCLDLASNENDCHGGRCNKVVTKQAASSSHPISDMLKAEILMMCTPKSCLRDERSDLYDAGQSAKRYHQQVKTRLDTLSGDPIWSMSKDQFYMMSSPKAALLDADKDENHSSDSAKFEQFVDKSHPRAQTVLNQLKPTIEYMSKADFLRLSALPEPVPMSALRDNVPMTVGEPTFDDSQVMSKISCEDTCISPSGNQEGVEEADERPEVSTSIEEDEEEDHYAWDGHMDDEEFWDMDIRRQSLGDIDELASQVSSRISTLLSKFREDNNSIKTRSVNL